MLSFEIRMDLLCLQHLFQNENHAILSIQVKEIPCYFKHIKKKHDIIWVSILKSASHALKQKAQRMTTTSNENGHLEAFKQKRHA